MKIGFAILFLITLSGCITMAPSRHTDDSFLSQKELLYVKSNVHTYLDIDYKQLCALNPYRVVVFATWCPHCITMLSQSNFVPEVGTIYVSTNYDIKNMEKLISSKLDTIFIISNEKYGSVQKEKFLNFTNSITQRRDSFYAVPMTFDRASGCKYNVVK